MKRTGLFLVALGVLLIAPVAALAQAEAPASTTEWFAVFMDGKKAGHSKASREVKDGTVTTTESFKLTISRGQMPLTVAAEESCVETTEGKGLSFKSLQDLSLATQEVTGTIAGGKCTMKITAGGMAAPNAGGANAGPQERVIDWPAEALLPEGIRLLTLKKGLKEGVSFQLSSFQPAFQQAVQMDVKVGPEKPVDLLGRVKTLHEIQAVLKVPSGAMESTLYVDDQHNVHKTIMSMMGIKLELVACSKEFAQSPDEQVDFLDRFVIPAPAGLEVAKAKAITYTLQPIKQASLEVPTLPGQQVARATEGSITVTVEPTVPAKGGSLPYAGADAAAKAALKPARYIQSDDPKIVELAKQAVGDAKDSLEAARRIETFVRKYITKKDFSVGYATASEVAQSRQGDCSEHAVLVAAMCRAAGIPAQVVVGMAYVSQFGSRQGVFGPHAWNRAFVGEQWVGLDAALDGHDAGHIALTVGDGNLEDFFGIISTLGCFRIAEAKAK